MKKKLFCYLLCIAVLSACHKDAFTTIDEKENNRRIDEVELIEYIIDDQPITLEKRGNQLVMQGDILIDPSQLTPSTRGAGLSLNVRKWSNNLVFYTFASNVSETDKIIIFAAMKDWQDNSNIVFVNRFKQTNYIEITMTADTSNSNTGMIGGKQVLNLASNWYNRSTVIHELGHALGLHHEHTRKDRDLYITIRWNNIKSDKAHNYEIYSSGIDYGQFDFNSIMIYDSYSGFAIDPSLPTIVKKDGSTFNRSSTLSSGDIFAINTRYPYCSYSNYISTFDRRYSIADFDGDGRMDFSIMRNDGLWLIDYAKNGLGQFGAGYSGYGNSADQTCCADYDGDGKIDLALRTSGGEFRIDYAKNGFGKFDAIYSGYGNSQDQTCCADYDGDGRIDLALRTSGGEFRIDYAKNGFGKFDVKYTAYGNSQDQTCCADYDGDGRIDLALRTSSGEFRIDYAKNGFGKFDAIYSGYGNSQDQTCCADYDGDGRIDLALRTSGGEFRIDYAKNGFGSFDVRYTAYGNSSDQTCCADYDGDAKADLAVLTYNGQLRVDYSRNGFGSFDAYL